MPSLKIHQEMTAAMYYLTCTVRNWYYVFDRCNRFEILRDSTIYCQENKGLRIYAYVFMLNHLHLIVSSEDVFGFVRDFKKYTSKEIQKSIIAFEPRILDLFRVGDNKYEFWQKTNAPKRIETDGFFNQKMSYIHMNPVRKGYVFDPAHWRWSSANPESEIRVDSPE